MTTDPLLTIRETAELIGVQPATIHNWRSSGATQLPRAYVVGKRPRYRRSEVLAWLESQREQPREVPA